MNFAKNASKQSIGGGAQVRTKGPLPFHINVGGDQVRDVNASWTSRDGGKHTNCTRDVRCSHE